MSFFIKRTRFDSGLEDDLPNLKSFEEYEKYNELVLKKTRRPYTLIIVPALVVTILFLIPFVWGIILSLTNYKLNFPVLKFNFGKNYLKMILSARFWKVTLNTFIYTAVSVSIEFVFGYFIASLLNTNTFMAKLLSKIIVIPLMVAPLISALLFKLMLNNQFGIINYFMSFIGLGDFPWGASPETAMLTVIIVDVWVFTPFVVLITLAGMRGLPKEPFEAAAVDGAKGINVLKTLTLPMMMPTVLIAVIFRVIDSIKVFDIIWGMTAGGPGDATTTFSIMGQIQTFGSLNVAKGTTILVITWFIIYQISQRMVVFWNNARNRLS